MALAALLIDSNSTPMTALHPALQETIQLVGAASFGAVIGWLLYYVNRYRSGTVQFSDLVTVIGAIGGGAVLALFPAGSVLFGAYGIGLAIGFFAYFARLNQLVVRSIALQGAFNFEWFLDGRRRNPAANEGFSGGEKPQVPMAAPVGGAAAP